MARILLGVSGGIAAYKALETARLLIGAGHAVRVIQTPASEHFVGRASFEAITGAPVLSDEFEPDSARGAYPGEPVPEHAPISHLALVQRADAYLIAPASANTLAKLAHGHADNLLSTCALAADCPVAVAPAMNDRMYRHPATRANVEQLAARGVRIVPPGEGALASRGEHGIGRMAEPRQLLEAVEALLVPQTLTGVRVLVTAGGTREPLDSVRYIGNRSSGAMGLALAVEAARRGAHVRLIAANMNASERPGLSVAAVATAAELGEACAEHFDDCDVLLMAAAVADFRPARPAQTKIKKDQGPPTIELEATEDVLTGLAARRRPGQVLVGFAAEHGEDAVRYGRGKLERKRLDAVVVNDISKPEIGFDAAENEVTIVAADGGERHVERTSKAEVARCVLDEVQRLRSAREDTDGARRADVRRAAGV